EQSGVISVPPESVYGTRTVYRIDDDSRLERIEVERVGESVDAKGNATILVRSEILQAGDELVTTQLPSAVSGLKVELSQ
ncbi:MAG: efflux RND transporter periplasmic adaptor subunit, partial [bacterium]